MTFTLFKSNYLCSPLLTAEGEATGGLNAGIGLGCCGIITPVGGGGIPANTEGSGTGRFGGGRGAVKPAGNWLGIAEGACAEEEKYCVRVSLCPDEEGIGGAKAAGDDVPKIGTWGVTEGAGVGVAELAVEVTSLGGGVLGGTESGLLLSGTETAPPPPSEGCEGIGAGTAGGGGMVPTTGDDMTAGGTMGTTVGGTVVVAPISVGFLV